MRKLGDHPHVVPVLDTGEDDGNPFIVSRYMPGGDVEGLMAAAGGHLEVAARRRDRGGRHPRARACARARDRPPRPEAGERLARRRRPRAARRLRPGHHRGPLRGSAAARWSARSPTCRPSRRSARPPGPRSDLYSLGALLYEMLTGQPPFPGDDAVSIISQHLHADPVPPSRHNPEVPEALDRAVLALLAKRPRGPAGECHRGARMILGAARREAGGGRRRARGEPARELGRRRLRRARARARAAARGRRRCARGPRLAPAAGRGARDRQDARGRGARHLRPGERRAGLLGPLPRGRGRARLLALGPGDPLLRARRRPRRAGLAARRRRGRGRTADPRGGREARHRAGQGSDSEEARFRLFDSVTSLLAGGGARPAARDRPRRPALGG